MLKLLSLLFLLLYFVGNGSAISVEMELPSITMTGVGYTIKGKIDSNLDSVRIHKFGKHSKLPVFFSKIAVAEQKFEFKDTLSSSDLSYVVTTIDMKPLHKEELNPIPLWLSIIPPFLAIILALLFKEVLSSLLIGILSGTFIVGFYNDGIKGLATGFISMLNHLVNAVAPESSSGGVNTDHVTIILFSILIGGMVSLISKNGGMAAVVKRISKYAKDAKGGQFATWVLGIGIFFDDYANTLVVGNTMRPMTDRLGVSREKLAYIVDSTAAPITAIALVSTWIGAELGYIQEGLTKIGGEVFEGMSVYSIFLSSVKYSFYPILALIFILFIVFTNRDFGPMLKAERSARANPIVDKEEEGSESSTKSFNALIPIGFLIFGTILSLLHTGSEGAFWSHPIETLGNLSAVIGNANSYVALLLSSILAIIAAVVLTVSQRILTLTKAMDGVMDGFKSMLTAIVILVLAWGLSSVTEEMGTAYFIKDLLVGNISPVFFPLLTFVVAALVAFSTGSSWSTMAIVYPTLLPAGYLICLEAGMATPDLLEIFFNTVSCVLAGAVLGDHCSPISDTTILSSLASSCDHLSHVRTQMPYALVVGTVAVVCGTFLSAVGLPIIFCYIIALAILYAVVKFYGKKVTVE